MSGLQLIEASGTSLEEIAKLAHEIWNIHYPPIIGQTQVDYMLDLFYSPESLKKQVKEGQHFHLIEYDGRKIGFIALSRKSPDLFFISKFYVKAEEQGKRFGRRVFKLCRDVFNSDRPYKIQLTVNRQNYKAINFYFKIGFRIREVADFDIGNGYVMNDFVMEWDSENKG